MEMINPSDLGDGNAADHIPSNIRRPNFFYFSFPKFSLDHNLLSSHILSKHVKIETYKTVSVPAVLCGYEISSLTVIPGV
jgi:hypothetical protein